MWRTSDVSLLRSLASTSRCVNSSRADAPVRGGPEDRTLLALGVEPSTFQSQLYTSPIIVRIKTKMPRFVLIHGAWHGGWCWERVVPLLRAADHEVLASDLPGMGTDRTPFAADVLGQWADFVAALVHEAAEPAVLVGHSRGGLVISEGAERAPDQIRARFIWRRLKPWSKLSSVSALREHSVSSMCIYCGISASTQSISVNPHNRRGSSWWRGYTWGAPRRNTSMNDSKRSGDPQGRQDSAHRRL